MPVEDGKVGIDKTCSDQHFEFSVEEGKGRRSGSGGVGAITVFDDGLEENFNFSDDFLTALSWDMGEREMVVCFDGRARWLKNPAAVAAQVSIVPSTMLSPLIGLEGNKPPYAPSPLY